MVMAQLDPTAGFRPRVSNKHGGIAMDTVIAAAARALASGDALEALKRVALRDDPHARALRAERRAAYQHWVKQLRGKNAGAVEIPAQQANTRG